MPKAQKPTRKPGGTLAQISSAEAQETSVAYLVRICYRDYDRALGLALSPSGILTGQWSLLRVLWKEENLTQVEIAKRMRVERASLTILLNTVDKAGLIKRTADKKDGRKVRVTLTPKARRLKARLLPIGGAINAYALRGFSDAEVGQLRSLLLRVIANLEA
jgi:DNA-binding MarR family transcriptional regulator